MVLIIVGAVVILIGVLLLAGRKKSLDKSLDVKFYKTSDIGDILTNKASIAGELGDGNYYETVEVKGKVECREPLEGELSKKPVVYYKSEVKREYEVLVEKKDSQGNTKRDWERRSERVGGTERVTDFMATDQTGSIPVDPREAEMHTERIVDRFEQASGSQGGFSISIGGTSLNFSNSNDNRTIGFKYTEYAIPVNSPIYILGEASDHSGSLKIANPRDKDKKFIVSTKSEDQLIAGYESSAKLMFIGGIALIIAGLGVAGYGLYNMFF